MALSAAVVKELQSELLNIEAEMESLRERADSIRRVLGEPLPVRVEWSAPTTWRRPPTEPVPDRYAGMTMRAVVSQKLQEHPGWKAADVTKALKQEGYKRGGVTRFSHRVYNEIWRMQQEGLVEKRADGGFALKEVS